MTLELFRAIQAHRVPDGVDERVAALYHGAYEAGAVSEGDALLIGDLQHLSGHDGLGAETLPLHALLALMFDALSDGSLCLDLNAESLGERCEFLGADRDLPLRIREKIPSWSALIGTPGEFKPLILRESEGLLYFQRWFDCERRLEAQLLRLLKGTPGDLPPDRKLKAVFESVLETNPAGGKSAPLKLDELQRAALGIALMNDFSILSGGPGTGKTTLIATLLRCMVRLGFEAEDIRLAAPTGRAAARMTESIRRAAGSVASKNAHDGALLKLEAQTLHRLLVYRPAKNDFLHGPQNPLEGRVLIVDEVSMVDAAMMARVLEAAPSGMRVILVGDREQLPSVEAGAVLADLLPDGFENGASSALAARLQSLLQVRLSQAAQTLPIHDRAVVLASHRRVSQALQPVVAAVRAGRGDGLLKSEASLRAEDGALRWPAPQGVAFRWLDGTGLTGEAWRAVLLEWRKRHWNGECLSALREARATLNFEDGELLQGEAMVARLNAIFERLQRAQILTLARAGHFGCERINDVLADALQPEIDPRASRGARGLRQYFSGLPILATRNNYTHRLFNGDIGLVLADREGRYRALFAQTILEAEAQPRRGYQALALDSLAGGWEPAFAMTVHKSQGSEYDEILLVVPPLIDGDGTERAPRLQRLLTREILYTGLTRARHCATLCGSAEAIELALKRRMHRASGLKLPCPEPAAPPGWLF